MTSLPHGPISPQLNAIHPAHQHSQPPPLAAVLWHVRFPFFCQAVMGGGRLTFVPALTAAPENSQHADLAGCTAVRGAKTPFSWGS